MKWQAKSTLVFLAILTTSLSTQAENLQPKQYSDFDTYVLALSWQNGFCQSMHDRQRSEPSECSAQQQQSDKRQFLTVHGLWPGLPQSLAQRGVDQKRWMRYGCSTRPVPNLPEVRSGQKCRAPELGLSSSLMEKLTGAMPGAGGNSCLERYEFAKHGACFGFNPEDYFATMVRLNSEIRQSSFGNFLAQNYGKVVTREDFTQALNNSWGNNVARSVKLTCNGNPAYLTEMQISLLANSINNPLSAASFAPQKHPGNCTEQFRLDAAGY